MPPRVTLDLAFYRRWSRPLALKPFLLLWLVRPDRGLPFCACVLPGSSSPCGTRLTSLLLRLVSGYRFWLNYHCLRILVATWVWRIASAWHANPEVSSFLCTLGSCEPSVSGSGSMARISLQYAWILQAQLSGSGSTTTKEQLSAKSVCSRSNGTIVTTHPSITRSRKNARATAQTCINLLLDFHNSLHL